MDATFPLHFRATKSPQVISITRGQWFSQPETGLVAEAPYLFPIAFFAAGFRAYARSATQQAPERHKPILSPSTCSR